MLLFCTVNKLTRYMHAVVKEEPKLKQYDGFLGHKRLGAYKSPTH